ncbi:isomerase, partial [Vibrio parahaemolyticus]
MDAALGFRTGYIDNPILEALSWHGKTRRSCFGLFSNALPNTEAIQVSFGKHLNDSSSFILDLDNRYPSISLEDDVVRYQPNFDELIKIDEFHAVIVTAQSSDSGYVLRYFAPKIGISEDLATGSAQCSLAPYWFEKLGKEKLTARQLSRAGGYFEVARGSESTIVL